MTMEENSVWGNEKQSHAQGRVCSEGHLVGTEQRKIAVAYLHYCSVSRICLALTAILIY